MKTNFFYWLKIYLGFSRKESRGFLLLLPFLSLLVILPSLIQSFQVSDSKNFHLQIQSQLDSMTQMGLTVVGSSGPIFNPNDTLKKSSVEKQLENINRVPFVEADSIILQIVPGIGPGTAGRIIKYRDNLGGFHNKDQLVEVFGLKPETINLMWEFFDFSPRIFRKIPLNKGTIEEISTHPYMSYGEAKVLIAFRKQHGAFRSEDDLLKIRIFKKEWISKISPYLDFGT